MAKFDALYMLHSTARISWLQSSQHPMNSGLWFALLGGFLMLIFLMNVHCNNKNKVNDHAKPLTLFGIVTCNIKVPCWNTQF